MNKSKKTKHLQPKQTQAHQPGVEFRMRPEPQTDNPHYIATDKLKNKVALITGGDSGIGRAVALLFAKEGADIVIVYLDEHEDANKTKEDIQAIGGKCLLISGDVGDEKVCQQAIKETINEFNRLDILVNNAAEQHPQPDIESIGAEQLEKTFRTNIFSFFYMTKAALAHLKEGGAIINTSSVTAYRGSAHLLDYSSTKGAIVAFTRSLSQSLLERNIRVNGVAPGPVWTPLIPASFSEKEVAEFGSQVPMQRAAQPYEIAPCYVFLASQDSSYMTGQMLHPNGGAVINT